MPAWLLNSAIALPEHAYSQDELAGFVGAWLADRPELAQRALAILANSGVKNRYTVRPPPWYLAHTSVSERSVVYREEMVRLSESAARQALAGAGMEPAQIGLVISTSCTGLMIPPLESHLFNRMGFRPETERMPLTALGCVAGASAVAKAATFLDARPDAAVLIVSTELASLTAQVEDFSMANIVSAALFGDGAAATVVGGERFRGAACGGQGPGNGGPIRRAPRVVGSRSVHFPDTLDMMGFDNCDSGLKIFLSPQVPRFIRNKLPEHIHSFLADHGVAREGLRHFLLHPGGEKVIAGLEQKLRLSPAESRFSRAVLRDYGNLSSATVLFMLHHFEREAEPAEGDLGLLLAVGPGFCAEMALLQW